VQESLQDELQPGVRGALSRSFGKSAPYTQVVQYQGNVATLLEVATPLTTIQLRKTGIKERFPSSEQYHVVALA
jgi:hypothetical protein